MQTLRQMKLAAIALLLVRVSMAQANSAGMVDMNAAGMSLMSLASGSSENPASWPMPMIMTHFGNWNTMFMGNGFLSDIQQSGPRGGDKLYSTNWFMASAEHRAGSNGAFQAELMLSLEPATVTGRRYPLLFQTGETAYGRSLVDGQHPHNFIMSLGFHYVRELAEDSTLDLYFAPVGDPALGPVAYPHRASAMELPQAPISHHWQDSTHIADDVVTVGIRHRRVKLEASGFYGSEPAENRWVIESGPINSWSTRLWFFPTKNWAAQVSFGRIAHPEALEPGDQTRVTASVEYTRPMRGASWSSTAAWGRTHNTVTLRNLNAYLAESLLPLTRKNFLTGRFELVDKDDLFHDDAVLEQHLDSLYGSTFRIGAYTLGYTRNIDLFPHVETGIGANFSAYTLPDAIKPYYGAHPAGGNVFVRFRFRPRE
ncbi:MAG: hypothetical protein JO099_04870 [Acidobacteriia bacterium]|nr:hypothetical protein [Terriglobia bacterium]